MNPIYPQVKVKLVGKDGNAWNILGICNHAARRKGVPQEEIDRFNNEAMSGDYNDLLRTCMKWFSVS